MYPPWWGVDSCLWRNGWSHRPRRCSSKHRRYFEVTSRESPKQKEAKRCTSSPACGIGLSISASSWDSNQQFKKASICAPRFPTPHQWDSVQMPWTECPPVTGHMRLTTKCPEKNSWATEQRTCCGFKRPQVGGWPVFSSINGLNESSWPTEVPQLRLWPLLLWSNNLKLSRTFSFWSSENSDSNLENPLCFFPTSGSCSFEMRHRPGWGQLQDPPIWFRRTHLDQIRSAKNGYQFGWFYIKCSWQTTCLGMLMLWRCLLFLCIGPKTPILNKSRSA